MRSFSCRSGFTLIELLVSMTVLVIISLILVRMTNSVSSTWRYTRSKIEQFRSAGDAFEAMSRRISQATLNTAWDYDDVTNPKSYLRQSDLRFISGASKKLIDDGSSIRPTHCTFFQAPLGFVENRKDFAGLENLLNTWGYYIEFNKEQRPDFIDKLPNAPPERYRYRLMEMMQPSEDLNVYSLTSGKPKYNGLDWFGNSFSSAAPPVHVLAENVIAMIILPKLAKKEDPAGTLLASDYEYDSTKQQPDPEVDSKNQLPPIVQITLVAIDEVSANRVANGSTPPAFHSLLETLFRDASRYEDDLDSLKDALTKARINYRIFTSNVAIRGAKWTNLKN